MDEIWWERLFLLSPAYFSGLLADEVDTLEACLEGGGFGLAVGLAAG